VGYIRYRNRMSYIGELTLDRCCGVQGGIQWLRLYSDPDFAETFCDEVSV